MVINVAIQLNWCEQTICPTEWLQHHTLQNIIPDENGRIRVFQEAFGIAYRDRLYKNGEYERKAAQLNTLPEPYSGWNHQVSTTEIRMLLYELSANACCLYSCFE